MIKEDGHWRLKEDSSCSGTPVILSSDYGDKASLLEWKDSQPAMCHQNFLVPLQVPEQRAS